METGSEYHGLRLLTYCGGGAYGDVFYCQDISGRRMAVKIISKQKLGDQWKRELQGIINYQKITVDSPKLLKIFHVEEDPDYFFYTMEPADSLDEESYQPDTLGARLKKGPLPQKDLFEVLSHILDAIRIIHDSGFVHQDIKPDNILFVKGQPRLADLGLISASSMTMSRLAGTLDFLPPEILHTENPDSLDRKTHLQNDFYAFGKVIYCTVTGQPSNAWPALPPELPVTLAVKYFLRLALRLCDKNPALRLNSAEAISREFAAIERKLLFGETVWDKLGYLGRQSVYHLKALLHPTGKQFRHYLWMLLLILLFSGGLTWYLMPPPPLKPALNLENISTKKITSSTGRVSMTIPRDWQYLPQRAIDLKLKQNSSVPESQDPLEQKREAYWNNQLKMGGADMIICNYDQEPPDNLMIQEYPQFQEKNFFTSKEDFLWEVRKSMQGNLKYDVEVYDARKTKIAGYPCYLADWSLDGGRTRIYNLSFFVNNRMHTVCLTAQKDTFEQRQREFLEVLNTLKFQDGPFWRNFPRDLRKAITYYVRLIIGPGSR